MQMIAVDSTLDSTTHDLFVAYVAELAKLVVLGQTDEVLEACRATESGEMFKAVLGRVFYSESTDSIELSACEGTTQIFNIVYSKEQIKLRSIGDA